MEDAAAFLSSRSFADGSVTSSSTSIQLNCNPSTDGNLEAPANEILCCVVGDGCWWWWRCFVVLKSITNVWAMIMIFDGDTASMKRNDDDDDDDERRRRVTGDDGENYLGDTTSVWRRRVRQEQSAIYNDGTSEMVTWCRWRWSALWWPCRGAGGSIIGVGGRRSVGGDHCVV